MIKFQVNNRTLGVLTGIVDDEDADLAALKWRRGKDSRHAHLVRDPRINGKKTHWVLHRIIMERKLDRPLKPGEMVDHADCNTMNNTRANLRLCTQSQNTANTRLTARNTSGYKGIALHRTGKWQAQLSFHKRTVYLGLHSTPEEAYAAYCKAAVEIFGEFARLK